MRKKRKNEGARKGAVATGATAAIAATENATPSSSLNVFTDLDFRSVKAFPQQMHMPNAPHPATAPVPAAEHQSQMSKADRLCAAIDAEVESRVTVIRDLTAARLAAFSAAWDLELSKLSAEERKMPFNDFLKLHPGRTADDIERQLKMPRAPSLIPDVEGRNGKFCSVLQDCTFKQNNSAPVTPGAAGETTSGQPHPKEHKDQVSEQISDRVLEMRSWYEKHCMRSQNLRQNSGLTPSVDLSTPMMFDLPGQIPSGGHGSLFTPMGFQGGSTIGVTPKTVRLPKHGEALLSINGSPLGQFGKTPRTTGAARMTRTQSRLAASKRNFRDL